ncbi:MAG: response regulator [Candidatus Marinimicrobia bacterium]|nr:response regulator [Candidatus Neomarinimicrobiota bacterium]
MSKRIKILLIDDNPDDRIIARKYIIQELREIEITDVRNREEYKKAIKNFDYNVVITDYKLNWGDGLEVLKEIKRINPDIPVIMFTSTGTEEIAVSAIKEGLDDYIVKSSKHFKRLAPSIINVLKSSEERKRARELESLYQELFEFVPVGLFKISLDGEFIDVNPEFVRILGYKDKNELISKKIKDFHLDINDWLDWKSEVEKKSTLAGVQVKLLKKVGKEITVLLNARLIESQRGELYIDGSIQDITKIMEYSKRLERSEKKYEMLFNNSNDIIILVKYNEDTGMLDIIDINEAGRNFLGNAKVFNDIVEVPSHVDLDLVIDEVYKNRNVIFEAMLKGTGDRKIPFEINASLCLHGSEVFVFMICRDITMREILKQETIKAQKLESLGILAGGLAHDFNNILTVILGNLSLIKLLNKDESFKKYIADIEKSVTRAREITSKLLTFSRGYAPIKKVTTIVDIIKESADFILSGSKSKVEITSNQNLFPVEVDVGQFHQVFNNFFLNADQAMPEGGIIRVDVDNVILPVSSQIPLPPGKYVKIEIEDKGIGIPDNLVQRIFDPYFTTKKNGSGLGLTTVYSIVKSHGGHVEVKSEVGKGTTFIIYIPATTQEAEEKEEEVEEIVKGSGRILVMDDNIMIRRVAGDILRQLGYSVDYASDGDEAILKYIKAKEMRNPFDLVILDLTIPGGKDGIETLKNLLDYDKDVKAILATGYADKISREEAENLGFCDIIFKPYSIAKLSKVIKKILID